MLLSAPSLHRVWRLSAPKDAACEWLKRGVGVDAILLIVVGLVLGFKHRMQSGSIKTVPGDPIIISFVILVIWEGNT